jgi:hypothetical protein
VHGTAQVLGYYVNLLKTISLKLTQTTVQVSHAVRRVAHGAADTGPARHVPDAAVSTAGRNAAATGLSHGPSNAQLRARMHLRLCHSSH